MPDPRFPGPRTFALPEGVPVAGEYIAPAMQGTPSQTFRLPAPAQLPPGGYVPPEGYTPTNPGMAVSPGPYANEFKTYAITEPWAEKRDDWSPEQHLNYWLGWYLKYYNAGNPVQNTPEQLMYGVDYARRQGYPPGYTQQRGPMPPDFEDELLRHLGYARTPKGFVPIPEDAKPPLG